MGFSDKLRSLLGLGKLDESFFESLEEILIEADLSALTAMTVSDTLRKTMTRQTEEEFYLQLRRQLAESLLALTLVPAKDRLNLYMVLGVNGAGKTTTIAKLARYFQLKHGISSPVLSAADTFRAAAIDQLMIHGQRLGLRVVHQQPGSDPGAVIYDTIESCQKHNDSLIIADTAGRMHNRENLVRELEKIDRIILKKAINGDYRKLLVIDSNTGQNGFRQAETFHQAVGVDAVILTKMDSTAKGGIAVNICRELKIPVAFICNGEGYDDIHVFDVDIFVENLIGK